MQEIVPSLLTYMRGLLIFLDSHTTYIVIIEVTEVPFHLSTTLMNISICSIKVVA